MDYWVVAPQCPGPVGARTAADGLICVGPQLLASRETAETLEESGLCGFTLRPSAAVLDSTAALTNSQNYVVCEVYGRAGEGDVGLAADGRLVMSGEALMLVHTYGGGIGNSVVTEWFPEP